MSNPMLDAALRYAALGWSMSPYHVPGQQNPRSGGYALAV